MDEYFFHKVFVDAQFWIRAVSLEDNMNAQKIRIDYVSYKKSQEKRHPKKMELKLNSSKEAINMKIKIKKAKFNSKKISTSFKIPSKYERMPLEK